MSTELSDAEKNRLERILFVRDYMAQGISMRRAAKELKMSRETIKKYLNGDPNELCRQQTDCNYRCEHSIVSHLDFITDCVNKGMFPSEIHRKLMETFHYQGSFHTFYNHLKRNAKRHGWTLNTRYDPKGHTVHAPKMISRSGILNHLWNNSKLSPEHKAFIFEQNRILFVLDRCIREFRDIFQQQCVNRLHCFIDKYSQCSIKPIESFASGLLNDIDAVENAVSYEWSNGFVEGTNNRVKMVKRTMFGRCSRRLLEAKMLLHPLQYC